MNANPKHVQTMEVLNYAYRLSQVVKRLDNGRAVSRDEMDRLLEQRDSMSAAALELQAMYPELHGICERMSLRLRALVGGAERPARWRGDSAPRARASSAS